MYKRLIGEIVIKGMTHASKHYEVSLVEECLGVLEKELHRKL